MIKAKKILYRIGKIYNILQIVFHACSLAVLPVVITVNAILIATGRSDGTFVKLFTEKGSQLGTAAINLGLSIASLVLLSKTLKAVLPEDKKKMSIVMIVFGVIGRNPLYLVAAIFGLITCDMPEPTDEKTSETPVEGEKPPIADENLTEQ